MADRPAFGATGCERLHVIGEPAIGRRGCDVAKEVAADL
jgi:hypothetical protein